VPKPRALVPLVTPFRTVLRSRSGAWTAICVGVVAALLVSWPLLWAPGASAEPSCTDTWTGPSAGDWATAADWSSGVPGSTDVACIPAGSTVEVTAGSNQAVAVDGEGALVLSGGSLELSGDTSPSSIASLTLAGGTLSGPGTVHVSGSFSWSAGQMSGSGKTVIDTGATGSINPGGSGSVTMNERELVNAGTLTWSTGSVYGGYGARIDNVGTFKANSQDPSNNWFSTGLLRGAGAAPLLLNTGTLVKSAGNGLSVIQFATENDGIIENADAEGQLSFTGGHSRNPRERFLDRAGE